MTIPPASTAIVLPEDPFHSWRITPHRLEKVTFMAISMHQAKAAITDPGWKKLCPTPNPKNCEYHRAPASEQ